MMQETARQFTKKTGNRVIVEIPAPQRITGHRLDILNRFIGR